MFGVSIKPKSRHPLPAIASNTPELPFDHAEQYRAVAKKIGLAVSRCLSLVEKYNRHEMDREKRSDIRGTSQSEIDMVSEATNIRLEAKDAHTAFYKFPVAPQEYSEPRKLLAAMLLNLDSACSLLITDKEITPLDSSGGGLYIPTPAYAKIVRECSSCADSYKKLDLMIPR